MEYKMKMRMNVLLPIALALILPLLGLKSLEGKDSPEYLGLFAQPIASFVLYILWYILWYFRNAQSLKQKRIMTAILISFVIIVFTFLYVFVFESIQGIKWSLVIRIIFAAILFLIIQYALKAQENISRLRLEKEQIQTENYKAQLKVLRNQIDPHFLFNSLNTLRSMVRQQHENSEKFVISLSDFE